MAANHVLRGIVLPAVFLITSACAAASGPTADPALPDLTCGSSQSQVKEQLQRLNAAAAQDRATLVTYSRTVDRMLIACDAEARTMNGTLADDWKTQSFSIRKDLERLERATPDALGEMLPPHRRRVERLIATYTAMYANPGRHH